MADQNTQPAADQEDLIGRLGGDGLPQFTQ